MGTQLRTDVQGQTDSLESHFAARIKTIEDSYDEMRQEVTSAKKNLNSLKTGVSNGFKNAQGDYEAAYENIKNLSRALEDMRKKYDEKIQDLTTYQNLNGPNLHQLHFDVQSLEQRWNHFQKDNSAELASHQAYVNQKLKTT